MSNLTFKMKKKLSKWFQINSQLLEAIQQKVELSQQLEQWKIDMQELLEEQMTKKMKAHEGKKKSHLHSSNINNNNNDDKSANDSDTSQVTQERKLSKLLSVFFQRS